MICYGIETTYTSPKYYKGHLYASSMGSDETFVFSYRGYPPMIYLKGARFNLVNGYVLEVKTRVRVRVGWFK